MMMITMIIIIIMIYEYKPVRNTVGRYSRNICASLPW